LNLETLLNSCTDSGPEADEVWVAKNNSGMDSIDPSNSDLLEILNKINNRLESVENKLCTLQTIEKSV
jgi:hypothetical protein